MRFFDLRRGADGGGGVLISVMVETVARRGGGEGKGGSKSRN